MQIREIEISKIKPDKDQPRQSHPEPGVIEEMARTIKEQGLINPIEVDDNMVVVTGHLRLEAAKEAGLKTVPCSIVNPENEKVRFQRQVIENLHQNSMHDMDTAKALKKIISFLPPSKDKKGSGGHNSKGIVQAAKAIGKSESYVREKLELLTLPPKMQKAIANGLPSSLARALKQTPEAFQQEIESKMIGEEFQSRESASAVVRALKLQPDEATEILNIDFTGMDEGTVNKAIAAVVPDYTPYPLSNAIANSSKINDEIYKTAGDLMALLKAHEPADVGAINIISLALRLRGTVKAVCAWLGQPDPEYAEDDTKLLEQINKQEEREKND